MENLKPCRGPHLDQDLSNHVTKSRILLGDSVPLNFKKLPHA